MNLLVKLRKGGLIRFYFGLVLLGIVFTVIGIVALSAPKSELLPVTAVITEITEEYDNVNDGYIYHVIIDYEVNGVKYTGVESPSYSSSMEVGDKIEIFYDANNPELLSSTESDFIIYVLLAVGIIALAVGIFSIVKNIKTPSEEFNEYDRVDMSSVSEKKIEEIRNSDEPMQRYFFHFDKNIKQSYVLEDELHRIVYEAKMQKLTLVKDFTFDFINHLTLTTKTMQIGHTVSSSVSSGSFSYHVPISSAFTVDGVKNWDYLAERGYGFDFSVNGIRPCFNVKHYGVKVAYLETAGADLFDENTKNPLKKLPVNGFFRVDCRDSDLDMVFMVCFSIARAIFYEND